MKSFQMKTRNYIIKLGEINLNFTDDIKKKIMDKCWCNINNFNLHLGKKYWHRFRIIKGFLRSLREDDKKQSRSVL